jgi:hypothetical protein
MKARVSHLHRKEADWLKLTNWVPEAGELVIYDPDEEYNYARVKVGDGISTLTDLPFFIQETIESLLKRKHYQEIIDSGNIVDYLN